MRAFSDWDDPPPGFAEADPVAHSGPVTSGGFVRTLVLTDIATGWTECAPIPCRGQTLPCEVPGGIRGLMPFELRGFDTDNDSVFINETRRDQPEEMAITTRRNLPRVRNGLESDGEHLGEATAPELGSILG